MQSDGIATEFSPKLDLPYRYFLAGFGFLFAGVFYLLFVPESLTGHYIRSRDVLILVHLFGLGFVSTIMMGAMYQLLSVVLETRLFSEPLGRVNFYLYLLGLLGMIFSFHYGFKYINIAGAILAGSLLLFVLNCLITIIISKKMDLVVMHVLAGVLSLLILLILGALMSENLLRNFFPDPLVMIRAHLTFALFGWIIMTTMGFSYKLIPMFTLSHGYSELPAKLSLTALLPGLFGFAFFQIFGGSHLLQSFAVAFMFVGVGLYLLQMYIIIKNRMRKRLEPQIIATIFADILLFAGSFLGILAFSGAVGYQGHISFVILLLLGFAGLYIVGLIHKILPFLQWYNKYSSKIGKEKVPLTKDMIDESLIDTTVYFWLGGTLSLSGGAWFLSPLAVKLSALALLFSIVLLSWNVLNVFRK